MHASKAIEGSKRVVEDRGPLEVGSRNRKQNSTVIVKLYNKIWTFKFFSQGYF